MTISTDDRTAITELLATHGHLIDAGELDRLDEVLTEDAVYDVTDLGAAPLNGIAAVQEASLALGAGNPIGHHVTNIVLAERADGRVFARSKGIGVHADGTAGTATYEDTIVRGDDGWRIAYRKVIAHRSPLGGKGSAEASA